ncbi:uncharacterized protein PFL1_03916 [Pseudozyma flocculosa PF-1]|uniref:Thioredoxin domain-containing protein n=2 Tax=Pseudozyma flocculosa TaxID=84751 RepID=A0A5C3EXQ9_9BASI|nr:uncharacterized protein PFL1_03916 [Pseudozyma flocculosa PF-1]EPQ28613.1 hypothetical protein PFL1_03916 [Pseudozyma flocculosa PF-1]SPO36555.1 uncharacterized protein PSFLO_02026 [Pseudozyma flocculosa]
MPLDTTHTTPPSPTSAAASTHYLVFFSSGSPPWCPDCVDAQPAIQSVFVDEKATNGAHAYMILVGEKPEWKTPENRYRKEYGLKCIPTILRIENGKETARLEDDECKSKDTLAAFVA